MKLQVENLLNVKLTEIFILLMALAFLYGLEMLLGDLR